MSTPKITKNKGKELLQKSIDAIPTLQKLSFGADQFTKWQRDTEITIERIFSADSRHLKDFKSISYLPSAPVAVVVKRDGTISPPPSDPRPIYVYGLNQAKAILESMIEEIETFWEDDTILKEDVSFWSLIHPSIAGVAKSRFEAGHYADSVETAFKYINETIKAKVKKKANKELDGAPLMNTAFSPNSPIITLDDLSTESGRNIQQGFMQIFAGAMTGIRNPKAHSVITIDKERAIHFLFLASLLMHKLDEAI